MSTFKKIVAIGVHESSLDDASWQRVDSLAGARVMLTKDAPNMREEIADADCILAGLGVAVTREDMEAAPNLKLINVQATAFGKIDIDAAKERNVIVSTIPGYSTQSVAEFTFAVLLEHLRQLETGRVRGREENYSEEGMTASEIGGKVFGVVGLGAIGTRVSEIARGFGADVHYWSRTRKEDVETAGCAYTELDELIETADILSINIAHCTETEKMFDAERIAKLKPGAIVINTAPMEVVDLTALAERLRQGDITFILDHADEMSADELALIAPYENCIIYPPIGYITDEARVNKQNIFVGNLEACLAGAPTNTAF